MPTITYTPDQQKQIDALNKAITDAQNKLTSLNSAVSAEYSQMNTAFSNLDGNCYKNKPSTFTQQLSIGNLNINNCCNHIFHTQSVVDKCHKSVGDFNYYYNNWKTYTIQTTTAQSDLNTAQTNLSNYYKSIGVDPNVVAQQNAQNAILAQQQSASKSKYLIFTIIVIAIIFATVFLLRKSS